MQYGICHLSTVPVRAISDDSSELISQLLFGEHFKILERRKFWCKIRMAFDKSEGWVSTNQISTIEQEEYNALENSTNTTYSSELISIVEKNGSVLIPIVLGSAIQTTTLQHYRFDGASITGKKNRENLIETALLYLNAPYLWGGKTPFGIDCSGFTQMVYKINGYHLFRNAAEQATQGCALSFIEESEPGDLAFFDNSEGLIHHVGLIMENNYIIHSHGKVRIDRLDHTGIFNTETGTYTHNLRVIKKVI